MKALVLAGGFGTRLSGVLRDIPKPLAPVAGKPFLEYLILQLSHYGFREIVLSTGHLADKIVERFGDGRSLGVKIEYSHESSPAGTGGAVRLAAPLLGDGDFLVVNGDSVLDVDLRELVAAHRERRAVITMALAMVDDTSRYGGVSVDESSRVVRFEEKGGDQRAGLINAGIYSLDPRIFAAIIDEQRPVSLEREVFPKMIGGEFYGYVVDAFFWDIGIPAAYDELCAHPEPLIRAAGKSVAVSTPGPSSDES